MTVSTQVVDVPFISARQITAARTLLKWDQQDLATRSGVPLWIVSEMEESGAVGIQDLRSRRIKVAFEVAGVIFIAEDRSGTEVRLMAASGAET